MNNVLEYLEKTVKKYPDKIAFVDEKEKITFNECYLNALKIGNYFIKEKIYKEPIYIFMNKSINMLQSFFGVLYSGNFYVPIDINMPIERINLIINNVNAKYLIYDIENLDKVNCLKFEGKSILYNTLLEIDIDMFNINCVKNKVIDTDPVYISFTSGSTGIPKGVVGYHRGIIDYIDNLSKVLNIDENTVFGNQSPLHLDACMKEIYCTLKCASTTYLIPKKLFSFPVQLVKYLNDNKINTICWVVTALQTISSFGTFNEIIPKYLHTIAFGSEVFLAKQFNIWKKTLKNSRFINLYGPTEATGMSCYYEVDKILEENEKIPIGKPFLNTDIFLLNDNGELVKNGEEGEIYIRGTCITYGYYNDFDKTSEVFVQNPLNNYFREIVYKTGDIGKYDENGILHFISRKDYQIKHMGHRIELGEIDVNTSKIEKIKDCCTIYSKNDNKIVLYYCGEIKKIDIMKKLRDILPKYMLPNVIIQLDNIPLLSNGKKNRIELEKIYLKYKKARNKNEYKK